jgi:ATP-dependent Lon protease
VILPTENKKYLVEIPEEDGENIEFIFCDCIKKVLENALVE